MPNPSRQDLTLEVQRLKAGLETANDRIWDLQGHRAFQDEHFIKSKIHNGNLKRDNQYLNGELAKLTNFNHNLIGENNYCKNELYQLRNSNAGYQNQNAYLKNELRDFRYSDMELNEENMDLKDNNAKLTSTNTQEDKEMVKLCQELARYKRMVWQLEGKPRANGYAFPKCKEKQYASEPQARTTHKRKRGETTYGDEYEYPPSKKHNGANEFERVQCATQ